MCALYMYVPYHEAGHVSCMTRSGACGAVVVTLGQHKNDGCYSLEMAGAKESNMISTIR